MLEDQLVEQWLALPTPFEAELSDGRKMVIFFPGVRNLYDGPDFIGTIALHENLWLVGNVEIHRKASDWYRHKHHLNLLYNHVLFHVVLINDKPCYNSNGQSIPALVLPHLMPIPSPGAPIHFSHLLENVFLSRLEQRKNYFLNLWSHHHWNIRKALWHHVLIGIGKPYFSDLFEWLGFQLPWAHLFHLTAQIHIEHVLFDHLQSSPIPVLRKMPFANQLEQKLLFFTTLLFNKRHYTPHDIMEEGLQFFPLPHRKASLYFINALFPVLCTLFPKSEPSLIRLVKKLPAEKNAIIVTFAKQYHYQPQNMLESQAILEWIKQQQAISFSSIIQHKH